MEVVETKARKQSVAEMWQSLKSQFASTRKHVPKSQRNWNAFSKRLESSINSVETLSSNEPSAACEAQPFILGVPAAHHTSESGDLHNGLRSTAKEVLRILEEEKEARAVLVNLDEGKKSSQVAAAISNTPQINTCCEKPLEQARNSPLVGVPGNNDDGTSFSPSGKDNKLVQEDCYKSQESSLIQPGKNPDHLGAPTRSNSSHVVKVNSTSGHLKSKLSEETEVEGYKDQESKAKDYQVGKLGTQENSDTLGSWNHEDSKYSKVNSGDEPEGQQNEGVLQDISRTPSIPQSTCKPAAEITSSSKHTTLLEFEAPAQCSLSALSTLDVNPSDIQEEGPTSATDEELMKIINKDVNCLHDLAIDVRYEALHSLHRALLGDFVGEVNYLPKRTTGPEHRVETHIMNTGLFESAEKFAWCVEEVVVKPVLKIFGDCSERCRYLAVSILIALLQSIPSSVITLLPYIIPVIASRLPIKSLPTEDPASKVEVRMAEKSEDLRLLLVKLLHGLLKKSKAMIHPFASDVATILTAAACDLHPEVLMETFAAMTFFGEICGMKLKPVAKQLILVVTRSLSHNRHRVRVAAVRAIHRLVLCGAHESIYDLTAFRDPNTVPIRAFYHPDPKTQYLALLAGDKSIQVREQLLRSVGSWLRELDERKEHECRLVPYLLSGFTDESPIVQNLAFQLMQEVGHQYEEENENEVKDIQIYLPGDIDDLPGVAGKCLPQVFKCLRLISTYSRDAISRSRLDEQNTLETKSNLLESTKHIDDKLTTSAIISVRCLLLLQQASRPNLGARILVRNCCSVMLHALGGDLEAWTSGTKSLAADLLHTMLLFVEEHITMHLQQVIVMLLKALKEPLIETKVSDCANVIGYFVDPTAYLLIILSRITGELYIDASVQQLGQAVKLLAKFMEGSPASRLANHIPEICSVLSESDLMKSIQLDVNQSIVAVAKQMVRAWSEQVKEETISIIWILLNAAAAADFCRRPALEAESALQTLSTTCGYLSGDALIGAYGEMLLDLLPHPQFWAMRSLDVLVFCRVVQVVPLVPPSIIERVFSLIVWFGRGSWDPETKLRLIGAIQKMVRMSVATASTQESEANGAASLKIEEGIARLLEHFFIPCLEQLQEGSTVLRDPTLATIFEIVCKSSTVFPSALLHILFNLEKIEQNKQEPDPDEEEAFPLPTPSRETLLEILHRLRKT